MLCLQKILNIDNLCTRIYLLRRKWVNISTAAINCFKNNIYIISFWGLSINYVTYFFLDFCPPLSPILLNVLIPYGVFTFLTPPSFLVTHFTKYPYSLWSNVTFWQIPLPPSRWRHLWMAPCDLQNLLQQTCLWDSCLHIVILTS